MLDCLLPQWQDDQPCLYSVTALLIPWYLGCAANGRIAHAPGARWAILRRSMLLRFGYQ